MNGAQAQLTRWAAGGDQVPLMIDGVEVLERLGGESLRPADELDRTD